MAAKAVRLRGEALTEEAAREVDRRRHRLQVRRVDAGAIPAEVIDVQTNRDRADVQLVRDAVSEQALPADA
jgi:hypothetical protein